MRRSTVVTTVALVLVTVVLSLVTNLAADVLPGFVKASRVWIWAIMLVLTGSLIGFEVRRVRGTQDLLTARGLDPAVGRQGVDLLAAAVRDQWRTELAVRALSDPEPIPLRWSVSGRSVAADPADVVHWDRADMRLVRLRGSGDVRLIAGEFDRLPHKRMVILGEPGAGKTVFSLLLTLDLLDRRQAGTPSPVLVSLSSWDPAEEHLWSWLERRIGEDYPALGNAELFGDRLPARLIADGMILPILDGLDEVPAAARSRAITEINGALIGPRPLILTCRTVEYEAAVRSGGHILAKAAVVEIDSLDPGEAAAYLVGSRPADRERWQPLIARIQTEPDDALTSALRSPLMVWLAHSAYADPCSSPGELLDRDRFIDRAAVERHLVDALLPAVYRVRPLPPGASRRSYPPDKAARWLRFLARSSPPEDRAGSPLVSDIAWWRLVARLSVSNRILIALLLGLCGAVLPSVLILLMTVGFDPVRLRAFIAASLFGILLEVAVAVFLQPPSPGRMSPGRSATRVVLTRSLLYGIVGAVTIGSTAGIGVEISGGHGLRVGLAVGAAVGAGALVVSWLNRPVDVVAALDPRSTLRADRAISLTAGALGAAILGSVIGAVSVPAVALAAAVAVGPATGLAMSAWGWYSLARLWFALRGRLPWRPMTFLDDAHHRGVLRQAGGVYQFRHARLQERLATATPPDLQSRRRSS